LRRATAEGGAAPALLPRRLALLDQVEALAASVAGAIESRGAAAAESSERSEGWKNTLEQVRAVLDEIAASLESAERP
jgi:hypothetical protein